MSQAIENAKGRIASLQKIEEQAEELLRQIEQQISEAKQDLSLLLCPFSTGERVNLPVHGEYRDATQGVIIDIKECGMTSYYVYVNPVRKDGRFMDAPGYITRPWDSWAIEQANEELLAQKRAVQK